MTGNPWRSSRKVQVTSVLAIHPDGQGILAVEESGWYLDRRGQLVPVERDGWILPEGSIEPVPGPEGRGYKRGPTVCVPGGGIGEVEQSLREAAFANTVEVPGQYRRQAMSAFRETYEETGYLVRIWGPPSTRQFRLRPYYTILRYDFFQGEVVGGTECAGTDITRVLSLPVDEFGCPRLTQEISWRFPMIPKAIRRWLARKEEGFRLPFPFLGTRASPVV